MAAPIDRAQILEALRTADTTISCYLDLESGSVISIDDTAADADTEAKRNEIMEGYGERFRYISGGHPGADDAAVQTWLDGEGL
ncbi:hypothetical protein [Herpetosiphon gulosus]|jgi:hypothetical protein|uniref:Uncharacterized protein n=1 Tax=Herpetosiphon gulosus TaxID=1973496 RepID=A0ABP9WZH9_9CHLR